MLTGGDAPTLRDSLLRDYLREDGGRPRLVVAVELRRGRGRDNVTDLDVVLDDGSVIELRPMNRLAVGEEYWGLRDWQTHTEITAN